MDENLLIKKCLQGNKEAFEPLVAKYKNLVYSIACQVLRNKSDASDAAQEVFLKVWVNLSRFDANLSLKAWIARITVNHCLNLNQKDKRLVEWDEAAMESLSSDRGLPEQALLETEKRELVDKALMELPPMYRVVMVLYHRHDLSYEEICKVTNYPMTIVKNRLYRARKMLAEKLKPGKEDTSWIVKKRGS